MKVRQKVISSPIPQYDPNKSIIPDSVSINPNKIDLESEYLAISFYYYNNDLCEVSELIKNRGREVVECFKKIGKSTRSTLSNNGINLFQVYKNRVYKKLWSKLDPDVDIREHRVQGDSRIFYFLLDNFFCVVAITNNHFEEKKNYH